MTKGEKGKMMRVSDEFKQHIKKVKKKIKTQTGKDISETKISGFFIHNPVIIAPKKLGRKKRISNGNRKHY